MQNIRVERDYVIVSKERKRLVKGSFKIINLKFLMMNSFSKISVEINFMDSHSTLIIILAISLFSLLEITKKNNRWAICTIKSALSTLLQETL